MRQNLPPGLVAYAWIFLGTLILSACASATGQPGQRRIETPTPLESLAQSITPTPLPGNVDGVAFIDDDREYYIEQLIPRDGIHPIYNPTFTNAENSFYADDELVMGVEINGDARAYSVGILRSREMVNDTIGGTPVLVTW